MRALLDRLRPLHAPDDPRFVEQRDRSRRFAADLRDWHKALAGTPLADRYWVWGGLLLGWAREGRPLAHDYWDADFGFRQEDLRHFVTAVPALLKAGFEPLYLFRNNDGAPTEFSFTRHGAKFEFFVMEPDGGRLRFHVYGSEGGPEGPPIQGLGYLTDQPLVPFRFVGRRWRRMADHDLALRENYGDWRTPKPDWWYMDDLAIESRTPYLAGGFSWSGELAGIDG